VLIENRLDGEYNKVDIAIERLKTFEPKEGYWLADSGGKDSCVILELAKMSGVKFDAHHSLTTIDPPELYYFIRDYHKETIIDHPEIPFLKLMVKKGFPQRQRRWCCAVYKERGGEGRKVITGIRWEESNKRRQRRMVETCMRSKKKTYLNVIIDWTEKDVWEFIHKYDVPYCKLYDEGFKRIGCLFCPMAGKMRRVEAERYPRIVKIWENYFQKLYDKNKSEGKTNVDRWEDGKAMFWWWMDNNRKSHNPDQLVMFE